MRFADSNRTGLRSSIGVPEQKFIGTPPNIRLPTYDKENKMKAIARFSMTLVAVLMSAILASEAQRTTTHTDETSNNTSACATPTASYVGTTSCSANFPGANDDASAGTDRNTGANTVVFDAVPNNVADFTHDNVDIHKLIYNGFGVAPDTGKVFANMVLWHEGPPFSYAPKSPGPQNQVNNHFSIGYASDDTNQVSAQLAYMQRLKIDGIVANPPGPLPPSLTQHANNLKVNDAMLKWKTAADGTSGFLYSVMTDQVMWKQTETCGGSTPDCVEKLMICSLDYMNTATTSTFTCAFNGTTFNGGGFFADSHYWKVSGRPVMSYFLDESKFFSGCVNCAVYNDNQTGTTCSGSADCWQKIYGGIAHHVNAFSTVPIVINRDQFNHLPTALNGGSFRWFNPTTSQTNHDLSGYDTWLTTAFSTTLPVALAGGLGKVDHAQSPFDVGDHIIMDATCGKTFLASMAEPAVKGFGTSHPLQAVEITTWDDYDEGTEMETGIDNCVSSFSASLTGTTLSWTIGFNSPGDESTIDHYAIFYSTDGSTGENLTELADVAVNNTGSYSYTLPTTLPSTTVIYVKAVGKPLLQNHMTAGVICTVCGSTVTLRPSTFSSPNGIYQNPGNVFDNNLITFANPLGSGSISTEIWSGFGTVSGTITAINLKVSSAYTVDSSFFDSVGVAYSTDGGSTWTAVYDVGFGTASSRGQQTDVVSLPVGTNLSTLQVDAFINGGPPSVNQQVYEIWIEVTR
ncbi:MAG TPA: hypothetical protein VH724_03210 [Candidatus Angelobacter sp.]|nr:hypothetical protein [Candidatus Angelobacter sp.]